MENQIKKIKDDSFSETLKMWIDQANLNLFVQNANKVSSKLINTARMNEYQFLPKKQLFLWGEVLKRNPTIDNYFDMTVFLRMKFRFLQFLANWKTFFITRWCFTHRDICNFIKTFFAYRSSPVKWIWYAYLSGHLIACCFLCT